MVRKIGIVGVFMAILYLPVASYADSLTGSVNSIEAISSSNVPNGSIVVISKEETSTPRYFHEKYAFVDQDCLGWGFVDYYGPAIDPNDANLLRTEYSMCTAPQQSDGSSD